MSTLKHIKIQMNHVFQNSHAVPSMLQISLSYCISEISIMDHFALI